MWRNPERKAAATMFNRAFHFFCIGMVIIAAMGIGGCASQNQQNHEHQAVGNRSVLSDHSDR
jgi:hypothetical protein